MSAPGSKKTKQEERKEKKSGRNAHLPTSYLLPWLAGITPGDGNRPANTHLYDRCKHLCDCSQLNQSCKATEKRWVCNKYVLEHSWKTCTPKQPDLLVGNWAIFEKRAGTPSWSDSVSHDCGSFVECGPTIMPHSPALWYRVWHTHTHLYDRC